MSGELGRQAGEHIARLTRAHDRAVAEWSRSGRLTDWQHVVDARTELRDAIYSQPEQEVNGRLAAMWGREQQVTPVVIATAIVRRAIESSPTRSGAGLAPLVVDALVKQGMLTRDVPSRNQPEPGE